MRRRKELKKVRSRKKRKNLRNLQRYRKKFKNQKKFPLQQLQNRSNNLLPKHQKKMQHQITHQKKLKEEIINQLPIHLNQLSLQLSQKLSKHQLLNKLQFKLLNKKLQLQLSRHQKLTTSHLQMLKQQKCQHKLVLVQINNLIQK